MSQDKIVDDAIEIAAKEGRAPEQADFMTAAVLNQRSMTAQERAWLQADLRAAELGTSTEGCCSSYPVYDEDDYPEDEERYGETCPDCGNDLNYCTCSTEDYVPEKEFAVVADCPEQWVDFDLNVVESKVEETKQRFLENHKAQCGCQAEVNISVTAR